MYMSQDVQFEEERESTSYKLRGSKAETVSPRMVTFLLKHGIVDTEKHSYIFLIIFSVIIFITAGLIFTNFVLSTETAKKVRVVLPPELQAQLANQSQSSQQQ